jgi:hypothetical protein
MCTVAQKDVLIELVALSLATLARRLPLPLPFNEDQIYLATLRRKIYSTSHNDLDFETLAQEIISIRDKYQHLPVLY